MPKAAPARMPMPAPTIRSRCQLLPWSISVTAPPISAPVNPPKSASVAMMAAELRPVGTVSTPVVVVSTATRGGGFGSFGLTTTCVEGGGGLVCVVTVVLGGGGGCCCVCTVVVVWAKAGSAIAVKAKRSFFMEWLPGCGPARVEFALRNTATILDRLQGRLAGERFFQRIGDGLQDLEPCVQLVVGLYDHPWRDRSARLLEHVARRLLVRVPPGAVAPVFLGDLVLLVRRRLPVLEAPELLVLRDRQPELHDHVAVLG